MKEYSLFDSLLEELRKPSGPVTCLGMTFESDEARRAHFIEELRNKLHDKEFRKIEGFPIGSDEDILNLSDPPYYTACPNPFIEDFIKQHGKPYDSTASYSREPFAADVSEGKGDRKYYIHTYHTKVPPSAICTFVEHYCDTGDIVLDFFCGSGMTGIGSQIAKPGGHPSILLDLSTSATFISYFQNLYRPTTEDTIILNDIAERLRQKYGMWYLTTHNGWIASRNAPNDWNSHNSKSGSGQGVVKFVVWSDVVSCPECAHTSSLWDLCVDLPKNTSADVFECPTCGVRLAKERKQAKRYNAHLVERAFETVHDGILNTTWRRSKRIPVLISYEYNGKRYEKAPDSIDLENIRKASELLPDNWIPSNRMPEGDESRRNDDIGITHVHHFFSARTLHVLGDIRCSLENNRSGMLGFLTSILQRCSLQNRYMPQHRGNRSREVVGPLSGTLYVPYYCLEINPIEYLVEKAKDASRNLARMPASKTIITCQSATSLNRLVDSEVIDYIFIDPPFGSNLQYSELSYIVESWLKVWTSREEEAVTNKSRNISLENYTERLRNALLSANASLKPGRWLTMEFHNSQNAVWAAIQAAVLESGLIIADVRTLDKRKGTTKQLTLANTVKQDLIISAYKPNGGLEARFKLAAGTEDGVWDFVRTHLKQLPVFVSKDGVAEVIAERQNYLLFDRMVAFHVQHGVTVPMSAAEFYAGLVQRFFPRDDMYFLPEQAAEYDKKRMTVREILQLQLFISDEASAIQWLKQQFTRKPQSFQDIHPQFLKEIGGWKKHETGLELSVLLNQNFLCYDGKGPVPEQIHAYLSTNWKDLRKLPKNDPALVAKARDRWYVPDPNKAGDLEKLREKTLLKEFEEYKAVKKKLKIFRLEAVRAGFKKAWQERDYAVIVAVADKIPNSVLEEDPKLLLWYDQAVTRMGGE